MTKFITILFLWAFTWTSVGAAQSIEVPKELQGKTITMILPYPPGGGTDSIQRFMASQAEHVSGIRFVVVNRAGALGVLAGRAVAESPPDGLTLLGHANETLVINPVLKETGYVPVERFIPVSIHAFTPQFVYVGHGDSKIRTLDDLILEARTNINFRIGYTGTHMIMYWSDFFDRLGIKNVEMVRYKSTADLAVGTARGDIAAFGADAVSGLPFVQGKKIKAIATTWTSKLTIYPDAVPMNTKSKGFASYNIQMISLPAGTPDHIVNFYNRLFRAAAKTEESKARWTQLQVVPQDLSPKEVAEILQSERTKETYNSKFLVR